MDEIKEVSPREAQSLANAGAILLDVREPEEFAAGHIPDAQLIPLGELADQYRILDSATAVVVVCRSGQRSAFATQFLINQGFDATNLAGGMLAWHHDGQTMVAENGEAQVI